MALIPALDVNAFRMWLPRNPLAPVTNTVVFVIAIVVLSS
jgi:hypothetical protein